MREEKTPSFKAQALARIERTVNRSFTVTLKKPGPTGFDFSKADTGVLTVSNIHEQGSVADWNKACGREKAR